MTNNYSTPMKYEYNMAVFIDGPNLWRYDKSNIGEILCKYGAIKSSEVFIKKYHSKIDLDSYIRNHITPRIHKEEHEDIDGMMIDRINGFLDSDKIDSIDLIVLGTQDGHFTPVAKRAKKFGKKILIIGSDTYAMNQHLKCEANYFESLKRIKDSDNYRNPKLQLRHSLKPGQFKHIKQVHFSKIDEGMILT